MTEVADDTIIISIRSRLAKTGKSTVARIIAEALAKVGLSCGVEDTYVKRSESITKDLMDHCDAIGVLADRNQSLLIRVEEVGPAPGTPTGEAQTIADLRELLEFKRKEIADLRAGVATENELHDILYRLGKAAAEARGVRFNGSIMGEDGVEQDIAECIAAKVRERKATTLSK